MTQRLSATDGSILTLIAETPELSEDRFDVLLSLVRDPVVRDVAHVLRSRDWATKKYSADIVGFARTLHDTFQSTTPTAQANG